MAAAPFAFQSSGSQTTLLELYTSEGCSSCPPAETWFSRLKESPRLWKDFVPVAFHVDYWDHLGWRDPWSSKTFTDRQQAYASAWRSDSVYTPEFVFNGKEWGAWSTSQSVPTSSANVGVLKVLSADLSTWQITFTPGTASKRSYEAYVALLASGVTSNVKAGENKDRHLTHDFVVISLHRCRLEPDGTDVRGTIESSRAKNDSAKAMAIAVWVTYAGRPEPLQATGGWLRVAP